MTNKVDYNNALAQLRSDPVMERLINKHGVVKWVKVSENIFADLIEAIISQQLSDKAAMTILKRFRSLFNTNSFPAPQTILATPDELIRKCGTSAAKANYMKNIAAAVVEGSLEIDNLVNLSDEQVIEQLVAIKGIGRWTAEMVLIFSLGRVDVFSVGDLGLRTAVANLYGIDREDTQRIEKVAQQWKPFRSIASCYLWKSLEK